MNEALPQLALEFAHAVDDAPVVEVAYVDVEGWKWNPDQHRLDETALFNIGPGAFTVGQVDLPVSQGIQQHVHERMICTDSDLSLVYHGQLHPSTLVLLYSLFHEKKTSTKVLAASFGGRKFCEDAWAPLKMPQLSNGFPCLSIELICLLTWHKGLCPWERAH